MFRDTKQQIDAQVLTATSGGNVNRPALAASSMLGGMSPSMGVSVPSDDFTRV